MRKPHAVATRPACFAGPRSRGRETSPYSLDAPPERWLWGPAGPTDHPRTPLVCPMGSLVLAHPTLRALPDSGQLWGPARVLASDNRSGGRFETHRNGPRRSQVVV